MHQYSWSQQNLPVPATLEEAISERNAWCDSAALFHKNEEYYRGLLEQIGELFGDAAKTADDGTVYDTVLCIKVPELVKELKFRMDGLDK